MSKQEIAPEAPQPLPCPFCGDKTTVVDYGRRVWVRCQNNDCGAVGRMQATKAQAITAWNTIARAVASRDELLKQCETYVNTVEVFIEFEEAREYVDVDFCTLLNANLCAARAAITNAKAGNTNV